MCPLGPRVSFYTGRTDSSQAGAVDRSIASTDTAEKALHLNNTKTLQPEDVVALMNVHAVVEGFYPDAATSGKPQVKTPGTWDVSFYKDTAQKKATVGAVHYTSDEAVAAYNVTKPMWQAMLDQTLWQKAYEKAYLRLPVLNMQPSLEHLPTDCSAAIL
ncbi:ligninase h2 precursor [Ophiostoma piceae UAMH 11346]|uniref:Peroxidase n=1 Tax=Ophiostoma piceae (strain UAMH 11346) TaxID=1262450 RepID=S3CWQ5_OPHP1|nr:ligninase h2 precursor [Ophiostoma piceae UAMH 11346]